MSAVGSYRLDKRPPKLTARNSFHHEWLRHSPHQAQLEGRGQVYGCLESGQPVSVTVSFYVKCNLIYTYAHFFLERENMFVM